MTKFGDNLRNLCKVKKITQQALSKKTKDLHPYDWCILFLIQHNSVAV